MYNLDNVTFGRQDGEVFRTIYKYGNGQIWWDIDAKSRNVKARYYDGTDGSITTLWDASTLKDDLTTLKTRQRWLTLASGVSEMYDDADYHPYAIVTSEYVHISGGFKTSTDISASTSIITNMVPPAKKRWVPLYNISKNAIYFGYITTGGSNLTTSNLPAGNYVIDFGYQKAYGDNF